MKNLYSRHRSGFTLIEVVIAIALVGVMMTSIFALMNSSFRSTYDINSLVYRIFYIKNGFFDPEYQNSIQKDPSKIFDKRIEDPSVDITFSAKKSKNKSIENSFKNVYRILSMGKWQALKFYEESIVGFQYIAPPKKEKK
jgi:prepilin-type N-terminal cleavage/methylation domain-containing protein